MEVAAASSQNRSHDYVQFQHENHGCGDDTRISAEEMDEIRKNNVAYEYLCHLKEAKIWLEAMLKETLPSPVHLEEGLRNGVYLAKLGNILAPDVVPLTKIYDIEQRRYHAAGLQFRHTDNINYWLRSLDYVQLPKTFHPETTDVYDKKNMPRVIYCLHALSTHLFKIGKAPLVQDLYGKAEFTDDEIGAVRRDLEENSNPMPSFQRIGGLLEREVGSDTAAMRAAVADVNKFVDLQDTTGLRNTLQNPAISLKDVEPCLIGAYVVVLQKAKEKKKEGALNRSLNDSYSAEDYSESLTQPEIQGYINYVNVWWLWQQALKAAGIGDKTALITVLKHRYLSLEAVDETLADLYLQNVIGLQKQYSPCNDDVLSLEEFNCNFVSELQEAVSKANNKGSELLKGKRAVRLVNAALEDKNEMALLSALESKALHLPVIKKEAVPLYLEEMSADREECQRDLTVEEISASIRVLSNIAAITDIVDSGDIEQTWFAISCPQLHLTNLDPELRLKYWLALSAKRKYKLTKKLRCSLLTYYDIQDCVDIVNEETVKINKVIICLHNLNSSINNKDNDGIMKALQNPVLEIKLPPENLVLCLNFLKMKSAQKGSDLWLEDVNDAVAAVEREIREATALCHSLSKVNAAVRRGDLKATAALLKQIGMDECGIAILKNAACFEKIRYLSFKKSQKTLCPWVEYQTKFGNKIYLNLDTKVVSPSRPIDFQLRSCYLSTNDIQEVIGIENCQHNIQLIIRLQAWIRGYLARRKFFKMKLQKSTVKIQAWWRGILARRQYQQLKGNLRPIDPMEYYRSHERSIIRVQAVWRGCLARRAFLSLAHEAQPSFRAVRHFAKLLQDGVDDYEQELLLQTLKEQVGQSIRHNHNLSQQLDAMDLKIGLLIRNRISLQDVAAHGSRLRATAAASGLAVDGKLNRAGQRQLEHYQRLFYLLQTQPHYLARLLPCLPGSRTTAFLRTVVLAIFNFGSGSREDYLLLRLFAAALREEIRNKINKPMDLLTENPLVLKLVVSYARQISGQNPLKEMVGPLVEKVINEKNLSVDTNPVDIYKSWRNHQEMESGKVSELPVSVNTEQALSYGEVKQRLGKNVAALRQWTLTFLERITNCRDLIPYGILYVARVLRESLAEKCPQAPEKDILKVVGNFLYYQYINSAIVVADTMEMVPGKTLSYEQRRNLASIARILQFAATKQGFGEEAYYLMSLNSFIIECHERFKNFFRQCCEVEELENHFHVHRYTEATLISRPTIYISLQEMCDTHELLVKYLTQIAPDPMDPLCELLEEMGPVPSPASLLGSSCESTLCQKEMCLELVNHCELQDDDTEANKLFVSAKELMLQLLPQMQGSSLLEALSIQSNDHSTNEQFRNLSQLLRRLELAGLVSHSDGFQQLVTAVAHDICKRGRRRQLLRQEIQMLRSTKQSLEKKTHFFDEQISYYNEYIQKCLENLNAGKRKVHFSRNGENERKQAKASKKLVLRYSASRLHEKGVLIEVEGLPSTQFRNLQFEIAPAETPGIFSVCAKFMGVDMEKVDIDVQNLLQLQYEGSAIMDLFGKAKVNVNLLLFLLNRKFYSKT